MFPFSPSRISFTVGLGFLFNSPTEAMIMPEVQNPHWKAELSRNACCTRWSVGPFERPSMVCTGRFSTSPTWVMQERVGWPSTSTVQAPHCPSPHPYLVPVKRRSSRKTVSKGVARSAFTAWSVPFTLIVKVSIRYPVFILMVQRSADLVKVPSAETVLGTDRATYPVIVLYSPSAAIRSFVIGLD